MNTNQLLGFAGLCLAALSGCRTAGSAPGTAAAPSADLQQLAHWMQGHYSSQEQAARDTSYFDIRLHIVPIWQQRAGQEGYWFYVEQAQASKPQAPYRQRVYHLTEQPDHTFESAIFTLPKPKRFAGEWQKPAPLASLTPDSLQLRQGCSVVMRKEGQSFVGSTQGQNCPSELQGALYATSEVTLTRNTLISWDRGYDASGQQAWGAEKGGYIFKKQP